MTVPRSVWKLRTKKAQKRSVENWAKKFADKRGWTVKEVKREYEDWQAYFN